MNTFIKFNPGIEVLKNKITAFYLRGNTIIKLTYKQKKKGKGRRVFVDDFRKGTISINTIMIKRFIEYNGKLCELLYE